MDCLVCTKDITSVGEVSMQCCNSCYIDLGNEGYAIVTPELDVTELDFNKDNFDDHGC